MHGPGGIGQGRGCNPANRAREPLEPLVPPVPGGTLLLRSASGAGGPAGEEPHPGPLQFRRPRNWRGRCLAWPWGYRPGARIALIGAARSAPIALTASPADPVATAPDPSNLMFYSAYPLSPVLYNLPILPQCNFCTQAGVQRAHSGGRILSPHSARMQVLQAGQPAGSAPRPACSLRLQPGRKISHPGRQRADFAPLVSAIFARLMSAEFARDSY